MAQQVTAPRPKPDTLSGDPHSLLASTCTLWYEHAYAHMSKTDK